MYLHGVQIFVNLWHLVKILFFYFGVIALITVDKGLKIDSFSRQHIILYAAESKLEVASNGSFGF